MPNLETISLELIKSDTELPENIIAVAVNVDQDGIAYHSGLLVGVSGEYFIFHYPGNTPNYEMIEYPFTGNWYYHKNLDILPQNLSLSFKQLCETILLNAQPKYGFVYGGSFYNENGVYISPDNLDEVTTCVGFCINVITGFLWNNEYIQYEDWSEDDNESELYTRWRAWFERKYTDNETRAYRPHIRRITPAELTSSAFFKELPIRKKEIDTIVNQVIQVLADKRLNAA